MDPGLWNLQKEGGRVRCLWEKLIPTGQAARMRRGSRLSVKEVEKPESGAPAKDCGDLAIRKGGAQFLAKLSSVPGYPEVLSWISELVSGQIQR